MKFNSSFNVLFKPQGKVQSYYFYTISDYLSEASSCRLFSYIFE